MHEKLSFSAYWFLGVIIFLSILKLFTRKRRAIMFLMIFSKDFSSIFEVRGDRRKTSMDCVGEKPYG